MAYQEFKTKWLAKRVDYDHVYAFQCVDLPLEFYYEICHLGSGIWGNAIDYATNPSPTFKNNFNRIGIDSAQPGDTVVLYGLSGNPYGHMGLFDHRDSSGIWLLEQNMTGSSDGLGRSAIGVYRPIALSRIAAVWHWKGDTPPPPAPAPARSTVFLPSAAGPWHLYYIGSGLNPNSSADVKAVLRPDMYPPGLEYKIEGWVADKAVIITTQMFGRGVVWVKGTSAVIK